MDTLILIFIWLLAVVTGMWFSISLGFLCKISQFQKRDRSWIINSIIISGALTSALLFSGYILGMAIWPSMIAILIIILVTLLFEIEYYSNTKKK